MPQPPSPLRPRRFTALLLAAMLPFAASAPAATAPAVDAEISALIADLRDSGCRFQRNGRWHDAKRAAAHLQRKYDYARDDADIPSAEAFIDGAASRSSLSGRAYRVQCGDAAEEDSRGWFLRRLQALRAKSG